MIILIFKSSNNHHRQPLSQLIVNEKSKTAESQSDSMLQPAQQQLESTAKFSVNQSNNFISHSRGVDESDQSYDPGKIRSHRNVLVLVKPWNC